MNITKKEYNKLTELAYKDSLTGCWNRNYFNHSDYIDQKYYLVLVDINYLKETNDRFGHKAGDKLISGVVDKLKTFGEVIRYGGDEFIILIPYTPEYDFHKLNDKRYSYGWFILESKSTLKDTLDKADIYLYKHKEARHISEISVYKQALQLAVESKQEIEQLYRKDKIPYKPRDAQYYINKAKEIEKNNLK